MSSNELSKICRSGLLAATHNTKASQLTKDLIAIGTILLSTCVATGLCFHCLNCLNFLHFVSVYTSSLCLCLDFCTTSCNLIALMSQNAVWDREEATGWTLPMSNPPLHL